MDKVSTRIDIPVDLHNHIKIYCARNQITMRDLIVSSVSERILSKPVSSVPPQKKLADKEHIHEQVEKVVTQFEQKENKVKFYESQNKALRGNPLGIAKSI